MRKALLLTGAIFSIYSCGGGGDSGKGSVSKGFYDASLQVTPSYLISPAVDDSRGEPVITPDTFEVTLNLFYQGTGTPMRGYIKKAKLCIENDGCVNLPFSGVIQAGDSLTRSVSITSHKYGVPWVVLNPYEDEVFATEKIRDQVQGGVGSSTYQDSYYNSERTVVLPNYPLVKNSVAITSEADKVFHYSLVVQGYETTDGNVQLKLPKGFLSSNTIVKNSVVIDAGNIVCVDDGNGNIVDRGGGTNCSGTVDYSTGDLTFSILNVNAPTDVTVSYDFQGQLYCYDDGNGELLADCTDDSSVNYDTANITYSFRYETTELPLTVNIDYKYYVGTPDGMTFYYLLPTDTVDQNNPNKKYVYGRDIVVYKDGAFACSLTESTLCSITKEGRSVEIKFFTPQENAQLEIEYTKDTVYDFNPKINAREYEHLWNGQSTALIKGYVEVDLELEDGTDFNLRDEVTFEVVPKSGGQ